MQASLDELWAFFSTARNLEHLTPPSQGLRIVRGGDEPIEPDAVIHISVRPIPGIRVGWKTRILEVNPPGGSMKGEAWFIDVQEGGPFAAWHHRHAFRSIPGGGTAVMDLVEYALPMGRVGQFLAGSWVRKQVEDLFRFRREALHRQFGQAGIPDDWRTGWTVQEQPV